jgi:Tfp pilus assembly protein PilF
VFAIHPLRVESVAWVAERKDVLSGLFFMLTIGAYVRYARRPWSPGRYGLVMLLFALGLMCKPMLVTLPFVLLLLDRWPLQRVEPARRLVMEKLPLLALAAASCVVTILAQHEAIQSTGSYPPALRFENASVSGMVYLGQMVWPAGLAVFYPYPHNGLPAWAVIVAPILLLSISAEVFILRKTRPYLLVGWLWYLVMLAPVIGIVQAGFQSHADRYTYLPQIGIYVAVTWLAAEWTAKRPAARVAIGYLAAGVLAVLMVCAWKQAAYWQNSESLWGHTLDCTVDNVNAHLNLGNALLQKGRVNDAIVQYQQALQIEPDYAQVHYNLGNAFLQKGSMDDAITQYQEALRFDPGYAQADNNLGYALLQKGNVDNAIAQYQSALQIDPDYAEAHNNLGYALLQKGSVDEAIIHFQKALEIQPDYAQAHNNLGNALLRKGKVDEAKIQFQKALQTQSPIHQESN